MAKKGKIRWLSMAAIGCTVTARGRVLTVMVHDMNGSWVVIAAETPSRRKFAMDSVLDNHAHANLGECDSAHEALGRAAEYALKWRANRHTTEQCSCPPIGKPKKRGRR